MALLQKGNRVQVPKLISGNSKCIRGILLSESYGGELHFLFEFFWVVDSSSVD